MNVGGYYIEARDEMAKAASAFLDNNKEVADALKGCYTAEEARNVNEIAYNELYAAAVSGYPEFWYFEQVYSAMSVALVQQAISRELDGAKND
tara:strand:- start:934 stop:1212 length:279 start_codon:yes stop_codon:yes gene_type:complete